MITESGLDKRRLGSVSVSSSAETTVIVSESTVTLSAGGNRATRKGSTKSDHLRANANLDKTGTKSA